MVREPGTKHCAGTQPHPTNRIMDEIFRELGDLVLGSVPTMIFFVLLVAAYGLLVRRPLDRLLAERRARTTGAVEQARGAIAAAEAETSVYEDKLRTAKAQIYADRERKLAEWAAERESSLEQVRQIATGQIRAAREAIGASADEARTGIEAASGELAARIVSALLPSQTQEAVQ